MKRKIFTLIAAVAVCAAAVAEQPTADIFKTTTAPVIDGTVDAIWAGAPANAIALDFTGETPSLTADWKALWSDAGIFVLVQVTEDNILSNAYTGATGDGYKMDKPEIYFDILTPLADGVGAQGGMKTTGHGQTSPDMKASADSIGVVLDAGEGRTWAYKFAAADVAAAATNGAYNAEYFLPFSYFQQYTVGGYVFDKTLPMGFDVTAIDQDEPAVRNRKVWANDGTVGESWGNMDNCGVITLISDIVPTTAVKSVNVSKASAYVSNNILKLTNLTEVSIYSMTGQLVASGLKNNANLSVLKSGAYLIQSKDGKFAAKMIK